jgi:hypothetical protein
MLDSEDITLQELDNRPGSSMEPPRLSNLNTTDPTHFLFQIEEETANSELKELTQDGGKCSESEELKSKTNMERLWMFKVVPIVRTETLLFGTNMAKSTNNGMLYTLTNGRESQRRANSIKSTVSMLTEHSTLSHKWDPEDISISSEETLSSRLEMVEEPKNGTSINNLEPSDQETTTTLGIFKTQEEPITCKSGAPTQDGGKSSSTLEETSEMLETIRFLMFQVAKILKDKTL